LRGSLKWRKEETYMNIGDYIKHKDSNTGTGPEGSWEVSNFDDEYVLFDRDSSWCKIKWVVDEMINGNAILISKENGIIHHVGKHYLK
jgi:hypothetical protein